LHPTVFYKKYEYRSRNAIKIDAEEIPLIHADCAVNDAAHESMGHDLAQAKDTHIQIVRNEERFA
jgi:hypothetical protein